MKYLVWTDNWSKPVEMPKREEAIAYAEGIVDGAILYGGEPYVWVVKVDEIGRERIIWRSTMGLSDTMGLSE